MDNTNPAPQPISVNKPKKQTIPITITIVISVIAIAMVGVFLWYENEKQREVPCGSKIGIGGWENTPCTYDYGPVDQLIINKFSDCYLSTTVSEVGRIYLLGMCKHTSIETEGADYYNSRGEFIDNCWGQTALCDWLTSLRNWEAINTIDLAPK